jgi:hypothetical protein
VALFFLACRGGDAVQRVKLHANAVRARRGRFCDDRLGTDAAGRIAFHPVGV